MCKKIWFLSLFLLCVGTVDARRKERRAVVRFETTAGTLRVALLDETPHHRDNFLKLTEEGFYDGTLFHRVIRDFMIQGGDPDSREAQPGQLLGEGGVGYTLPAEFRLPDYYHLRGALAAAREADDVNPQRRSSGCQFYIVWGKTWSARTIREMRSALAGQGIETTVEMGENYQQYGGAPHLDGQYTVFGEIIEGLSVVKAIQQAPTDANDRPLADVRVLRAVVEQKPRPANSSKRNSNP